MTQRGYALLRGVKSRAAGHDGMLTADWIFTTDAWFNIVDAADPFVVVGVFL